MKRISQTLKTATLLSSLLFCYIVNAKEAQTYWVKVMATNKFERTQIANLGMTIDHVAEDYVVGTVDQSDLLALSQKFETPVSFELTQEMMDFPDEDSIYHNYGEMKADLEELANSNPDIVKLDTIGKSYEDKDIIHLTISTDLANSNDKPGIVFMGGHHAREHLSMETPLNVAKYLVREFKAGNSRIVGLLEGRQIHIIPMVNPDGAEYDISTGSYKMWRKNRRNNADGSYGVDLNRNYGFMWGTGGSSSNSRSDVYKGEEPFSEPETRAIKTFVENQKNLTILLSFHTFSELILYPWGHKYDSIENQEAFRVHKTMAETMARWNNYTPQQSSDLYIASGDTTDWSFGELGIISFTFELDPKNMWAGGFYPGEEKIQVVFDKNIEPVLYLIEHSDNPYRVNEPSQMAYGITSPGIIH